MAYWTTEEVADFLEITVEQVYESRRRKEYPGIIGKQRGRRLMFDADLVQAGPTAPESTNDPLVALLWTAQGIEAKLVEIINELRAQAEAQARSRLAHAANAPTHIRMKRDLLEQWVGGVISAKEVREAMEEEE